VEAGEGEVEEGVVGTHHPELIASPWAELAEA